MPDPRHGLDGQLGILAILHTWDRQLRYHVHLHCVVAGGALDVDGDRWVSARPTFPFPVRALSRAFGHRFLSRLEAAWQQQRLVWPESLAALRVPRAFRAWLEALRRKAWVVYAKPPFGGPATVLDDLARYTHRVALSNHRLTRRADGQAPVRPTCYRTSRSVTACTSQPTPGGRGRPSLRPEPRTGRVQVGRRR